MRRFAKLAFLSVMLSVVAVPVTCVDAHGPHSLYAPPDAQASTFAATLATHLHGPDHSQHHADDAVMTDKDADTAKPVVPVDTDGPVLTAVNLGFLLVDQQATEPLSTDFATTGAYVRDLVHPVLAAPASRHDSPDAPPPRWG